MIIVTKYLEENIIINQVKLANYSVLFDRSYLDKNKLEIDRFARYSQTSKKIYYITFTLPKNNFDYIVYPLDKDIEKYLSYQEWISGKNIESNNILNNNKNENKKEIKIQSQPKQGKIIPTKKEEENN